jgi:AcrR family transcriptional regulator
MPGPGKGGRYHHGDLRAALIDTAVEVIGERGVRGFSLAEASRRAGVAVSAPYAHFADRDDLLAAVTVRAFEQFHAALVLTTERFEDPADRLVAMARCYVRFAATHRTLFEVLYEAGLDKSRHPEIKTAEQPVNDAFLDCVQALAEGDEALADDLATAFEASARGHALLLLDEGASPGDEAIDLAAERAARATRALIAGRQLLGSAAERNL